MLRRVKIRDVAEIVALINQYAMKGEMLPRSRSQLYANLRDYVIAEVDGRIIGVGALSIIWDNLAEVRSLAIDPDYAGQGWGRQIVNHLLEEARDLELPQVFAMTYKPGFFTKMGFRIIDKKELPHKVWKDCLHCTKFPDCDEIAMVREV